jgi:hypothetical protein
LLGQLFRNFEKAARLVGVEEEWPPGWGDASSLTSQRRLRKHFVNHHPIKQSANRTDEPVVTARRATRPGGYERVAVRRGDLTEFRDALSRQVSVEQKQHRFHLGKLFA